MYFTCGLHVSEGDWQLTTWLNLRKLAAYIACGIGTSLALMILALYLQRLAFHHLPASDMIVSESQRGDNFIDPHALCT